MKSEKPAREMRGLLLFIAAAINALCGVVHQYWWIAADPV